jgi:Fic family protein
MQWNWELPEWPNFQYDPVGILNFEKQFLLGVGSEIAYLKTVDKPEYKGFVVEILSQEGEKSSRIEGEVLDRASLQSSIKKQFGWDGSAKSRDKESGMAELLCSAYETFHLPLSHEMLWQWHAMLMKGSPFITVRGAYRNHTEPMQIVSNRYGSSKVFFEAPPSEKVSCEMDRFIDWYNAPDNNMSILGKAAVAHVYFESIHPFEDGNGRIGRVVAEKILFKSMGRPILIALSKFLDKDKKEYYAALEGCNRTIAVDAWVEFFAKAVVQAQKESLELLNFLIKKSKKLNALSSSLNSRQMKVLLRMFKEGPNGFQGGLSAEKYIAITKTTRSTATRDLSDLVNKGALTKTGELRYTRYQLDLSENI